MSVHLKILRGSAVLSLNEIVGNGCSFVRSWILARVLSKGDFGVASYLTVTFLFLEFISKMAFGQRIISSKNGADPKFVDTAHTVQIGLGMLSAALLLVLAQPLAHLLGVAQLTQGMQLLALVPTFMAIGHLGAFTYAREMRFERSVMLEAVPQILITLAAWPVALWLKDFRAFIWLQIGRYALSTLVSYLVGGRRFALAFRKEYFHEILVFSWPMLVSGFIMLCSQQGDRLLMPRYGLEQLGAYGAAYLLAATPSYALLKIIGSIALPLMSKAAGDPVLMRKNYALVSQIFALCGALFAVALVLGGEAAMVLGYGSKYAGAGVLAAWLSCAHALRMMRGAPTGVALGNGETVSQMLGNIIRLSGLALVVLVVLLRWPIYCVAVAAVIGEALALLGQVVAVRLRHQTEMRLCLGPALAAAACVGVAALAARALPQTHYLLTFTAVGLGLILTMLVFVKTFTALGHETARLLKSARARCEDLARKVLPLTSFANSHISPTSSHQHASTKAMDVLTRQTSGYLDQKGAQLYYTLHQATDPSALVVLVGPFATERVMTYAPWVRWARFLAQHGVSAVHFDYRGVGESTGAFEDMSVADWLEDLDFCIKWIQAQNPGLPVILHGLGFGGLLAATAFERGSGHALLLWSPLARGDQAIRDALLRRMSFDLAQAGAEGPKSAVDYLAQLQAGTPVTIEGYQISTRLWKDSLLLRLAANGGNSDAQASRPTHTIKLKQTEVPLVAGSGLWQALNPRARMRHTPLNPDLSGFYSQNLKWLAQVIPAKSNLLNHTKAG